MRLSSPTLVDRINGAEEYGIGEERGEYEGIEGVRFVHDEKKNRHIQVLVI